MSSLANYWHEFLTVSLAHLLAVASPGPDFAIVLKQSIVHGRRTAVYTSLGVGTAILLHVTYSLLGFGLLVRNSAFWFNIVKYAGASYIAWLGIQALRAQPRSKLSGLGDTEGLPPMRAAFLTGFFTNALNPKATLFFLSLFVMLVSAQTPRWVQAGYGLWMALVTMAWFCFVSVVFTRQEVRDRFLRYGHWIDRLLGVVLSDWQSVWRSLRYGKVEGFGTKAIFSTVDLLIAVTVWPVLRSIIQKLQ